MSKDSTNAADPPGANHEQHSERSRSGLVTKMILAIVVVAAGWALTQFFGDYLSLRKLAQREEQLRALLIENPLAAYAAALLFYAVATGLSVPGAAILTVVYGWYFGFIRGVIVVSFASTAGATLAFLMSRYFFRETIQHRFGDRLAKLNASLQKEGPFYLLSMRLIPALPFFLINVLMGLTPIKTFTYWWVSQLGMLPGTMAYVFAGSSVPDLHTLAEEGVGGLISTKLLLAFAILGVLPLILRALMKRWRRNR